MKKTITALWPKDNDGSWTRSELDVPQSEHRDKVDCLIDLASLEKQRRAESALSDLQTREFIASVKGVPLNEVDTSLAVAVLRGKVGA